MRAELVVDAALLRNDRIRARLLRCRRLAHKGSAGRTEGLRVNMHDVIESAGGGQECLRKETRREHSQSKLSWLVCEGFPKLTELVVDFGPEAIILRPVDILGSLGCIMSQCNIIGGGRCTRKAMRMAKHGVTAKFRSVRSLTIILQSLKSGKAFSRRRMRGDGEDSSSSSSGGPSSAFADAGPGAGEVSMDRSEGPSNNESY